MTDFDPIALACIFRKHERSAHNVQAIASRTKKAKRFSLGLGFTFAVQLYGIFPSALRRVEQRSVRPFIEIEIGSFAKLYAREWRSTFSTEGPAGLTDDFEVAKAKDFNALFDPPK